jgi:hypothetical protein
MGQILSLPAACGLSGNLRRHRHRQARENPAATICRLAKELDCEQNQRASRILVADAWTFRERPPIMRNQENAKDRQEF